MALNFPGPYELRFNYSCLGRSHVFRHSLILSAVPTPGDIFADIEGVSRSGLNVPLDVWCDSVLTAVGGRLSSADSDFGVIELWRYEPLSFESTFVSAYNSSVTPNSASPAVEAWQETFSFRTVEGGIMKIVILEGTSNSNGQLPYPTPSVEINAVFDVFTNENTSLAVGRDTSYSFASLRWSPGQNEKLWKSIYR